MKKSCGSGNVTVSTAQAGLDGKNAYTVTTAQFTIPAVGATVSVNVSNAGQNTGVWAQVGQIIYIEGAGYFEVTASTITSVTFENLGYIQNSSPGTIIAIGSYIVPGGIGMVGSSGTQDYVARWTPDGFTLGDSIIRDNGSKVSIGVAPSSSYGLFNVVNTALGFAIDVASNNVGHILSGYAVRGAAYGVRALENIGIVGTAENSSTKNIGINGGSDNVSAGINVGGCFTASLGASNYAVQLQDGTEGTGKALLSITATGHANWGKITSSYTTGATGTFTTADTPAKTVTVVNGIITNIQ